MVSPEYTYYVYDAVDTYCLFRMVIVSVCLYSGNFKQISLFVVVYSLYIVLCPVVSRVCTLWLLNVVYCAHNTIEILTVYHSSQCVCIVAAAAAAAAATAVPVPVPVRLSLYLFDCRLSSIVYVCRLCAE